MKIEVAESLGYSYLRHVKQCWLVQTNWKASEHWAKLLTDDELESEFSSLRQGFDLGGSVFKGTRDCSQFLRQSEIDVLGVDKTAASMLIFTKLDCYVGIGNRVKEALAHFGLSPMLWK